MSEAPDATRPISAVRRIARNASSILLGDAAGEVLIGYSLVLTAVSLGPRGFGTFSEAQAFMEPFEAASAFGLGSVALTVAASRGTCDGTLRGTVLGIRMVSAATASLVAIGAAFATGRGNLLPLLLVIAIGMLVTPATMVSVLPFQWNQTVHRRIAVPFFVGVVRLGAAYLAYFLFRHPLGFQLAVLTAVIGAALINVWWTRRVYPEALRFDRTLARQLLSIGWPAGAMEFVIILYMRASYFFLHDSGAQTQGEFAAADRMLKPILAIAGALFVSSMPTIADLAVKRKFAALKGAYKRALLGISVGAVPLLGGAWFLSAWLLRTFAPAYTAAIWPFRVLAIGAFFMFFNMLSATYILAIGKFRVMMAITLVDLCVYLVLATHLIPTYGALGAAFSTALMESINTVIQVVVVYTLLDRMARGAEPMKPAAA